jgi:hypothetical protein
VELLLALTGISRPRHRISNDVFVNLFVEHGAMLIVDVHEHPLDSVGKLRMDYL